MPLHRCLSGSRPWCRTRASLVGLQVLAGQEEPSGPAGEAERLPVENSVCPRHCRTRNLRQHHAISYEQKTMQKKDVQFNAIQRFNFCTDDASQDRLFVPHVWPREAGNQRVFLHDYWQRQHGNIMVLIQGEIMLKILSPLYSPSGPCHLSHRPTSPVVLFSDSHPATINTHFHASQKAVSQPSACCGDDDLKLHHQLRRQVSFSPVPFVQRRSSSILLSGAKFNQVWFCDQQKTPTDSSHPHVNAVCQSQSHLRGQKLHHPKQKQSRCVSSSVI